MNHARLALAALMLAAFSLAVLACTYATGNPTEPHKYGALEIINWNRDLDGSTTGGDKLVTGIQGNPLAPPPAGEGGVAIEWDGSSLYWGTAGGSVTPGDAGQFYVTNDAGVATWVYPHGDVDASAADPGDLTVNAIQGYGVSASVPTTGNQLRWSGSLWGPAALNLAGGSGYVTGTLPTANQASQTLGGELSGTTASGVVAGPFSTASMSWLASVSAPTWTQATPASDVATQNLTITPQAPYASASTNKSPGNLVFNEPAPITAGAYGSVLFQGGGTTNASIESQFGRVTSGGGGSNFKAILGPTPGLETSASSLYLLANGVAPTTTNRFLYTDGTFGYINDITGSGLYFYSGGATQTALLASSGMFLGGFTLNLNFGTTPSIESGTTATLLTVATDKAGAALQLGGDAAANVIKLTTAAEMQTQVVYDAVSSPSVPSATQITVYVDTLDNKLKAKDNAGNVTVLAP